MMIVIIILYSTVHCRKLRYAITCVFKIRCL